MIDYPGWLNGDTSNETVLSDISDLENSGCPNHSISSLMTNLENLVMNAQSANLSSSELTRMNIAFNNLIAQL